MKGPLAAIDIGSNTIHLLVGKVADGSVLPLTSERVAARLGAGVDKTGRIETERLRVALLAVDLFARVARLYGVEQPAIVATSAVRDAANGGDLVGAIRTMTSLDVRLLSGEQEAELGFRGAMSAVQAPRVDTALVIDLGGGSAQLILGDRRSGPSREISLQLGTNRVTERNRLSDPPTRKQLKAAHAHALETIPDWSVSEVTPVIAIGGSARALYNLYRTQLTRGRLIEIARELSEVPSGVLARENGLTPVRARVLPAAAVTLAAILEKLDLPCLNVARTGLREGVILTLAEGAHI